MQVGTWIVTGGAGYIGSHVVRRLQKRHRVVVLDDFSTGQRHRLPRDVDVVQGSVITPNDLKRLFEEYAPDGVVHLAARKETGESLREPQRYETVNIAGVRNLVSAMLGARIPRLLFASSAAVYGEVAQPISEDAGLRPLNPYGVTKRMAECIVRQASGPNLRSLTFRPFNVVGAGDHQHAADVAPTSVLPAILHGLTGGPEFVVRGNSFDTMDGSPVRDYIHVADVAEAFAWGVEYLDQSPAEKAHEVVNLATGKGTSVIELLELVGYVTQRPAKYRLGRPRAGDPAEVVGAVSRAAAMGIRCAYSLEEAVRSAWTAWQVDGLRA